MTNNIELTNSTSKLFDVSKETKENVERFSLLDAKRSKLENFVTAHKVALVVASFFLVGLVIWGILSHKINSLKSEQEGMIKKELGQLAVDMERKFTVQVDGQKKDPRQLREALQEKGLSNVQLYTTLAVAQQRLYNVANTIAGNQLTSSYTQVNPLQYNDDYKVTKGKSDNPRRVVSYFTADANEEIDKKISIQVQNGEVSIQGDTQINLQVQAAKINGERLVFHDVGVKPSIVIPQDVNQASISIKKQTEKQHQVEIPEPVAAPSA